MTKHFLGNLGSFEDIDEIKHEALISAAMKILGNRGVAAKRKKYGKNYNKHMKWVRSHGKKKK